VQFLIEHGYLVLAAWVFLDQIGLPLPAVPFLLAAGALAGSGELDLGVAVAVSTAACLPSDLLWYQVGRRRGASVLRLICRISLEPDSCVRNTEGLFARHGARALLVAKFLPGLQTVAPPLAGIFRMRLSRFLAFDAAGALIWSVAFIGLGYAFSSQLERLSDAALEFGGRLFVLIGGAFAAYLLAKFWGRQRLLRSLRIARIAPEELMARLEAGEDVEIVDLRHRLDFEAEPRVLPGARHIALEEIDARHHEIARDRDVVLYCT
jgi:membrane protein DedA with SNARE-associated domain